MQDRFKFRAVLHQNRYEEYQLEKFSHQRVFDVMSINLGIEYSTIEIIAEYPNGDWAVREIDDKDIDLIQSTGIKDKNGKLIYEGDIVKDLTYLHKVKYVCVSLPIFGGLGLISHQDLKDYKFCKENWKDYKINDNVRRFDNRFKLANQGNKLHCFNMLEDRISDYEIIGNIYENPKLLKDDE